MNCLYVFYKKNIFELFIRFLCFKYVIMKINLEVFSDNIHTKNSTLRSLICLCFLIVVNVVYLYLISGNKLFKPYLKSNKKIIIFVLFVLSLVIISGVIGVQDPNKDELDDDDTPTTRAVVYGLLVGFVVYSFFNINAYLFIKGWDFGLSLRLTSFGVISVGVCCLFTYYCSDHGDLYRV